MCFCCGFVLVSGLGSISFTFVSSGERELVQPIPTAPTASSPLFLVGVCFFE
jgi:hypothetical protein